MITIKHPDGQRLYKTKPYWTNQAMTIVQNKLKKGMHISDGDWDRMIRHTNCRPRVAIMHSKYDSAYYIVTPETYPKLCRQMIIEWNEASWFWGKTLVDALQALKNNTCQQFWENLDDEYLVLELSEPCTIREDHNLDNLDTLLADAIEKAKKEEEEYKARTLERLDNDIAALEERKAKLSQCSD